MDSPEGIQSVECPEPVEGLSWVYILLMCNGMFYVGQTHDVASCIQRHADGSGSRQTKQLKEFNLVFVEGPMEPATAIKRERQIKKWSRAKKIALIRNDFKTLKSLSKSREAWIEIVPEGFVYQSLPLRHSTRSACSWQAILI